MKKVDALIIGAGPAGSMCGYLLQKAGKSCLVVDRATFPRDTLCGGGLTPKGWKLLEELIPGYKYEYNPIRRIRLMVEDNHKCDFETAIELRLVKRKEFDNQLLELYKSQGGEFMQGSFLRYDEKGDCLVVTLKSGEQIACRYLVGADGSTSSVRHFLAGNHDNGFLIKETDTYHYVDGTSKTATIFTYGYSEKADTTYLYYPNNGGFYRKSINERDSHNAILRSTVVYANGDTDVLEYEQEYDSKGEIIKSVGPIFVKGVDPTRYAATQYVDFSYNEDGSPYILHYKNPSQNEEYDLEYTYKYKKK